MTQEHQLSEEEKRRVVEKLEAEKKIYARLRICGPERKLVPRQAVSS